MTIAPRRLVLPFVALTLGVVLVGATVGRHRPRPPPPTWRRPPAAGAIDRGAGGDPVTHGARDRQPESDAEPVAPVAEGDAETDPEAHPETERCAEEDRHDGSRRPVRATPGPTAAPKRTLASTGIYGSAFAMDSKNNVEVGASGNQRVAHRFRASTSSSLTAIAVNQRGGPGCSDGNGGSIEGRRADQHRGRPSGKTLGQPDDHAGQPVGQLGAPDDLPLPVAGEAHRGQLYHIVFTNMSASPGSDYISLNEAFTYAASAPRQPVFSDDFAVLSVRGGSWAAHSHDTPVMDLTYANGVHDGNAYSSVIADHYGIARAPRQSASGSPSTAAAGRSRRPPCGSSASAAAGQSSSASRSRTGRSWRGHGQLDPDPDLAPARAREGVPLGRLVARRRTLGEGQLREVGRPAVRLDIRPRRVDRRLDRARRSARP